MAEQANIIVQIRDLQKVYEDTIAVDHIDLDIMEGEFLTFLGSSGCGKTTTLRIIAGFEEPTGGKVLIGGKDVKDQPPHERNVNTVFQSYALFPHMNIEQNVGFGLKMKKMPKDRIRKKVEEALKLVRLEGYGHRRPNQLSGGQKQRVAIARAIVNEPRVLLLDEPLGALDMKLRKQMQVELKHLQRELDITFVYVTHDQEEALTMSDRIAIMNDGRIEQIGTAVEIYENPRTRFVADFIGETNLFSGTVLSQEEEGVYRVQTSNFTLPVLGEGLEVGETVSFTVRPERIFITQPDQPVDVVVEATFKEFIYIGSIIKSIVSLADGKEVTVTDQAGMEMRFQPGDSVKLRWQTSQSLVLRK
ncbi:ABC transporter ATP-binding protein [Anaerotalea alkaliphila]|uniref:Spermidine/putrescine import ATP-binding protein PotA n=1 Tax=Anaerotalea alkaliphila TaxID=2662126 RepID=A0A7X5KMF9_9FIRM|nr:ABC transporter ATP-binding protein [Anaerotalea alkaliphila]NDL66678.1 ABC transporter ATP-binding protein [Anaerotalea alkaliphila]